MNSVRRISVQRIRTGVNEQFFFDRYDSYRIRWNGSSHLISTWSGSGWGSESAYSYYDNNRRYDFPYGTDQIVKYIDGSIELLFGQIHLESPFEGMV